MSLYLLGFFGPFLLDLTHSFIVLVIFPLHKSTARHHLTPILCVVYLFCRVDHGRVTHGQTAVVDLVEGSFVGDGRYSVEDPNFVGCLDLAQPLDDLFGFVPVKEHLSPRLLQMNQVFLRDVSPTRFTLHVHGRHRLPLLLLNAFDHSHNIVLCPWQLLDRVGGAHVANHPHSHLMLCLFHVFVHFYGSRSHAFQFCSGADLHPLKGFGVV